MSKINDMKTFETLKNIGVTLEQLYNNEKQINIHLSDKPYVFHVVLKDTKGYDCKISSFGANLYARTNKGLEYKQYKTLAILERELKKLIKNKVDSNGNITFSLNDEIYTF